MASLIKSPMLDETGKAILAALQGEEPAEQTGSKIKAPMSDETGKAILEYLQNGGGGSSPLVVTFSGTTEGGDAACDKTWAEIESATSLKLQYSESEENVIFDLLLKDGRLNPTPQIEGAYPLEEGVLFCNMTQGQEPEVTFSAYTRG